jgi:hypothetical protein
LVVEEEQVMEEDAKETENKPKKPKKFLNNKITSNSLLSP